jgi:hypothetical protein
MATTAKTNRKGKGQVLLAPGTRYEQVHPSITTLVRKPLALPAAKVKPQGLDKKQFILGLLQEAGAKGLTWANIQAQLKAKYGSAPKKRASLYAVLAGQPWHKTTGARGEVNYFLGKQPKRGKAK